MQTSKQLLLAAIFVLLVGLAANTTAQSSLGQDAAFRLPPITPFTQVNAIEVSDGTIGTNDQSKEVTAFGYSFLGRTTGEYPGSFTLSMNCTPAIPVLGEVSGVTGGSWTLPVYASEIRSTYAGSLYGTIAKGSMSWDKTGTIVYLVLNVDGGTQTWDGVTGYATFTGTLSVDEKTQKTTLNGDLVFELK